MVTQNKQLPALQDPQQTPTGTPPLKIFRISGDVIRQSAKLLPENQAEHLWWLGQYCRKHNLGAKQLGELIRKPNGGFYSNDTLGHWFSGARQRAGANGDDFFDGVAKFRTIQEQRQSQQSAGYIHTRMADEIWKRCRKALIRSRITFIFGESQIGKSYALQEYKKQHNHGQTIYMEVPTGANLGSCLIELAEALGIPTHLRQSDLRRRIIAAFDSNMLLIVDEAHRCFHSRYGNAGLQFFDFLRMLWNKAQCGIVISLTNEGRDEFTKGRHAKALQQLWRRRITPLQLPDYPPQDDLALFADAFGLEPAIDEEKKVIMETIGDDGNPKKTSHTNNPLNLQNDIIQNEGLGVWVTILEDAADMATEANRKLTWGAVIKAYCLSQAEAEIII